MRNKTFFMASLGCDKNRVDGERLLGEIVRRGCKITDDPQEAEIVIVNTCAFLNAAREESINAIFAYNALRPGNSKAPCGKLEKLVVAGCLSEKFTAELQKHLPEADVLLGVKDASALFTALEASYAEARQINAVGTGTGERTARFIPTAPHVKYLKIADGCFNHCTYCLIPKIRGKYVSYPMEELVGEARSLGQTEELVLVAQDTTRYGEDLGKNRFPELIRRLSELENIGHIRLLYCYPEAVTEELIREFQENPKLLKYIDLPMQHAEDRILKLMGRRGRRADLEALVKTLRSEVPGIALRSTFIAGFPSETEEEHGGMLSFLEEMRLDNCGFFAYSREAETPAYNMRGQVHPSTKKRWVRELYEAQARISAALLQSRVGETLPVLVDGYDKIGYIGRAYFQAPEIDGNVSFVSPKRKLVPGEIVPVKIQSAETYDLFGIVEE